ncbi:MAG: hypothetical protein KME35_24245 [Aphanocapsa sp. GSE-SYN-MK-11-07L]|jgi:hypothetical protein|nr:hypothetical protein [Aphanocapsa sp. GSE-SYN-MK-11-07L]
MTTKIVCPECNGNGFIRIPGEPDPWETSQNPFANEQEINSPSPRQVGQLIDRHSKAADLLKFAGIWQGDDLEECLQAVYENRSEAEF